LISPQKKPWHFAITIFLDGLSFVTGDSEFLPFEDSSFDVVVNVESSHCYGSLDAFLMQVKRVLRKDGHFLYVDLRADILYKQLHCSGMTLIKETTITPNVLEVLNFDNERKMVLIQQSMHSLLLSAFQEFAGVR
jgi:ubiquinone/menaquinone biosynthesis C-methylase UbiE